MELVAYWGFVLRQKWLIIASLCVSVSAAVLYLSTATPLYEASVKLLITDDQNMNGMLNLTQAQPLANLMGKTDPVYTQMEIIKTNPFMRAIIGKMKFKGPDGKPQKPGWLSSQLTMSVIRNTNIITVTFRHPNPAIASQTMDTLGNVAVFMNRKYSRNDLSQARNYIEKQLEVQKDRAGNAENILLAMKHSKNSVSIEKETESKVDTQVALETQRMRVDSELQGMFAQRADFQKKIEAKNAMASPFYTYWMTTLEQTNAQIVNLRAQKNRLTQQINQINGNLSALPSKELDLTRAMRNQRISSEIYSSLLSRYEELQIREAAQIGTIKIIEPAEVPDRPVSPNKKQILLLSFVLGIGGGLIIALVREMFRQTPQSVEELKKLLPYPIIGFISTISDIRKLIFTPDQHPAREAYRIVRNTLSYSSLVPKEHAVVLITSSTQDEGKTTTTLILAQTFAEQGKRVLVMNLDLRRPGLDNLIKEQLGNAPGLTDYLFAKASAQAIVQKFSLNVDVIRAGRTHGDPGIMLNSPRFKELLASFRSVYDMVFLDTAPVLSAAETFTLIPLADVNLLVVDMVQTNLTALKFAQQILTGKAINISGVLVNRLTKPYGYGYRYQNSKETGFWFGRKMGLLSKKRMRAWVTG